MLPESCDGNDAFGHRRWADGDLEIRILVPPTLVPRGGDEMSTLLRLFQHSESVLLDQRTDELTFENYHGS